MSSQASKIAPPPVMHFWNGVRWTCRTCGQVSADPCDCWCCKNRGPNGLLVLSTPTATVGLLVRSGVVVQAPPYARRAYLGQPANRALADAWRSQPVAATWLGDPP